MPYMDGMGLIIKNISFAWHVLMTLIWFHEFNSNHFPQSPDVFVQVLAFDNQAIFSRCFIIWSVAPIWKYVFLTRNCSLNFQKFKEIPPFTKRNTQQKDDLSSTLFNSIWGLWWPGHCWVWRVSYGHVCPWIKWLGWKVDEEGSMQGQPPPENWDLSPENRPKAKRKGDRRPTIHFQGWAVSFREDIDSKRIFYEGLISAWGTVWGWVLCVVNLFRNSWTSIQAGSEAVDYRSLYIPWLHVCWFEPSQVRRNETIIPAIRSLIWQTICLSPERTLFKKKQTLKGERDVFVTKNPQFHQKIRKRRSLLVPHWCNRVAVWVVVSNEALGFTQQQILFSSCLLLVKI